MVGSNLASLLLSKGDWTITARHVARCSGKVSGPLRWRSEIRRRLRSSKATAPLACVLTTWPLRSTEADNIHLDGDMVRNLLAGISEKNALC